MSFSTWQVLVEHLEYLSDSKRVALFKKAISATVKPGDRVLDLGCGSGVLGLMALQAGAAHLDAMDSSAAIELARTTFAKSDWRSVVSLHAKSSFDASLAELADVVVCDHIGYFGFDYGLMAVLADARERLLKPDARMIPCSLDLWLAPVCEGRASQAAASWEALSTPELRWVRSVVANTVQPVNIKAQDLFAEPAKLACVSLAAELEPALCLHAEFAANQTGRMDGLVGWFDAELAQGVRMNNSPVVDEASISRPQAFLPLERSIETQAGERIVVDVVARPEDDCLAWTVGLPAQGMVLRQSTFKSDLMPPNTLNGANLRESVQLNRRGMAMHALLSWCTGDVSQAQLRQRLRDEFPDLFPSEESARRFVGATLGGNLQ